MSNFLNEYFCNVGANLVNKLPSQSKCFTEYLEKPTSNSIFVESVTQDEVLKFITFHYVIQIKAFFIDLSQMLLK